MIYDKESERRDHLFNFAQVLKTTGVTSVMTSEISKEIPIIQNTVSWSI